MPALLEAPAEQNPFGDLIPKDIIGGENGAPAQQIVGGRFGAVPKAEINTPTDYGAFSDLIPEGGNPAGAQDFGLFQDLVPPSLTSETEKAVAATPVMSDFDKQYMDFEKKVQTPMLPLGSFHATMNALRSLSAGAGKYIFEGLQGFEQNRAKILANPPSEMTAPQADEIVLPDGSVMSQEQQNELEKRYHDAAVSQIPDAKSQADYFKQIAQNADTSQYVDPELANTIPARIAHAAGSAGVMALESLVPYAGIPLMVYHGALATEAETKNAGKTDAEAEAAGVRSAIGLALFGGASKLAALGVAKLLPEGASTVTKFLSQFLGQETANETSSRAINAWAAASDAPDGQRIEAALNALKDTTLEQSTLNTVYALAHASNAAGKEPVRPASAPEPKIQTETPEIAPATAGEPIEQAPMAEVLKPEENLDAIQKNATLPNAETRNQNQFQEGSQKTAGSGTQTGGDIAQALRERAVAASVAWQESIARNDFETARNATAELDRTAVESAQLSQPDILDDIDALRAAIRTQSSGGADAGPTIAEIGARSSQERQRPRQQLGKSPSDVGQRTLKTSLQEKKGEIENGTLSQRSAASQIPRPTKTGQDQPSSSERVGRSEQGNEVAGTPQAQEPIGVADAIAEIQRRNAPSTTGIAQRVHDVRATEGRQGEILPGEGVTAEEMVQRGRDLLDTGADPEKIIAGVSVGKVVTGDEMAVLRARHEQFSNATDQAADALRKTPNDPVAKQNYENAFKAETDFAQRIKPAATEWHKVGQSMQGETEIQTGTFTGLRRAFHAITGRDVTPKEAVKLDKTATKVQKANSAAEKAKSDFSEVVKKATKNTLPKTAEELRTHFSEKFKKMLPC